MPFYITSVTYVKLLSEHVYNVFCNLLKWMIWENKVCIKFCFRIGKTPSEIHDMLHTAFGDVLSKANLRLVFKIPRSTNFLGKHTHSCSKNMNLLYLITGGF